MYTPTLRRAQWLSLLLLAGLLAAGPVAAKKPDVEKHTVTYRSQERTYHLYVPESVTPETPAPLLVLLHGSGRDGTSLIEEWRKLADEEGILLVGPDALDPRSWAIPQDGPRLLRDVVDAVSVEQPVDSRRVYLFGHSAGANFALPMALAQSKYFAAAGVHAGAFRQPGEDDYVDHAERMIPIFLIVGTRDPYFPLDVVRATRDTLAEKGLPVELVEIEKHDHDYYRRSKEINPQVWEFLSKHRLEGEPELNPYQY